MIWYIDNEGSQNHTSYHLRNFSGDNPVNRSLIYFVKVQGQKKSCQLSRSWSTFDRKSREIDDVLFLKIRSPKYSKCGEVDLGGLPNCWFFGTMENGKWFWFKFGFTRRRRRYVSFFLIHSFLLAQDLKNCPRGVKLARTSELLREGESN